MSKNKVSIEGIDKAWLLQQLCNNTTGPIPCLLRVPMSLAEAKQIIEERAKRNNYYFDYVGEELGCGPFSVKINLAGTEIDSTFYNENHGKNAVENIVRDMRKLQAQASESSIKNISEVLEVTKNNISHGLSEINRDITSLQKSMLEKNTGNPR